MDTAAPSRAAAQSTPQTFSLNWVRGEGAERCASSQLLARAIEQLLGPVLRQASEADVAIEGTVTQLKPGWFEMKTRVLTPEGEVLGARTLQREAEDCASLTPSILLVLTLTLDPEAAAHGFPTELLARLATSADPASALLAELEREEKAKRAATSEPSPQRKAPPPKAPPASSPRVAEKAPTKPSKPAHWGGLLQLGPAVQLFVLPSVGPGAALLTGLTTPSPLSLTLSVRYWAPAAARFESFGEKKEVRFAAVQSELTVEQPALQTKNEPAPVASRAPAHKRAQPEHKGSADTGDEVQLLQAARRALLSRPEQALSWTDQHRTRFAHGIFVEEREAIAIEALFKLGRAGQAERALKRFLSNYPQSTYRTQLTRLSEERRKQPSSHRCEVRCCNRRADVWYPGGPSCYRHGVSIDAALAAELAALSPSERDWAERELALRARAHELAARLELDAGDVLHQLKQLQRSPGERLKRGLALGRSRPRIAE